MIELERRWLVKEFPKEDIVAEISIEQYYIANVQGLRVRLRKTVTLDETAYSHCVKYSLAQNKREEFENYMTVNQFNRIMKLYPNAKKEEKKRTIIDLKNNGLVAEVDEYPNGDIVVEVEFHTLTQMENFYPPAWFGEEIKDKKFSVSYVWSK